MTSIADTASPQERQEQLNKHEKETLYGSAAGQLDQLVSGTLRHLADPTLHELVGTATSGTLCGQRS